MPHEADRERSTTRSRLLCGGLLPGLRRDGDCDAPVFAGASDEVWFTADPRVAEEECRREDEIPESCTRPCLMISLDPCPDEVATLTCILTEGLPIGLEDGS